jgi:hypothetical protein
VVSSRSPTLSLSSSIHSHTSGTGRERHICASTLLSASERALICIHPSAQIFKSAIISSSSSSSHRRFIFLITTMTYSAGGAGGDEREEERRLLGEWQKAATRVGASSTRFVQNLLAWDLSVSRLNI